MVDFSTTAKLVGCHYIISFPQQQPNQLMSVKEIEFLPGNRIEYTL